MSSSVDQAGQAINLIRYIGDKVTESGKPIVLYRFAEKIGAPSEELADDLLEDLWDSGLVKMFEPAKTLSDGTTFLNVNLTMDGWNLYNEEGNEQFDRYGFIAMQFNNPDLDFIEEIVKPAVRENIGCDLVDMNDVKRAGIIDKIMREEIEGAEFVIADLTHDNLGAYWEAGYAEGLRKPVIYICEKGKFETVKTHFDTNHCTTITWSKGDEENFCQDLTATILRSLDQS